MMRPTLILTSAVLLWGCSSPSEFDGYTPSGIRLSQSEFSAWSTHSGAQPPPPLEASGSEGAILASGHFGTSDPCYDVVGFAEVTGNTVTLEVIASRRPGVLCVAVLDTFGYSAAIRDLSAGTYTVRIRHVINGRPELALEETVVVR